MSAREKLSRFLDALDEWGCDDNDERANAILDFIQGGYDLSAYEDRTALRIVGGTDRALQESGK